MPAPPIEVPHPLPPTVHRFMHMADSFATELRLLWNGALIYNHRYCAVQWPRMDMGWEIGGHHPCLPLVQQPRPAENLRLRQTQLQQGSQLVAMSASGWLRDPVSEIAAARGAAGRATASLAHLGLLWRSASTLQRLPATLCSNCSKLRPKTQQWAPA